MAINKDFRVKNGLYVGENVDALRGSVSALTYYGKLFDVSTSGALGTGSTDAISGQNTFNFEAVSGVAITVSDNNLKFNLSTSGSFEFNSDVLDLTDTGVSAGSYGSATEVPTFTVDAQGRLTAVSTTTISSTGSTTLSTAGDSTTGDVALLTEALSVIGTANEIETSAADNVITIGLPNDVTIGNNLTVSGAISGASTLTIDGDVTLGDAAGDTVTINAQTINPANIAAGTDNTVVVYNGSSLVTDEIDTRVWGTSLVDGTGTANRLSKWSDSDTIANSQISDDSTTVTIGVSQTNPFVIEPTSTSTSVKFANGTSGYHSICTNVTQSASAIVASFPHADYRSAKVVAQSDINNSQYEVTELLVIHDGSDTYQTEYGSITTGSTFGVSYTTCINGTSLDIVATNACVVAADVLVSVTQLTNT